MKRCIAPFALCLLAILCMLAVPSRYVKKVGAVCPTCPPPPPPPPTVGEFGGPLAGLSPSITGLFNGGYGNFVIKWDPIRGLGPVSTQPGCFTCHGAGVNVLTGTAGDISTVVGTRFGKFNPDNTFNYLDGTGTSPENEGGPVLHGTSNAAFGTLPGCNQMKITSHRRNRVRHESHDHDDSVPFVQDRTDGPDQWRWRHRLQRCVRYRQHAYFDNLHLHVAYLRTCTVGVRHRAELAARSCSRGCDRRQHGPIPAVVRFRSDRQHSGLSNSGERRGHEKVRRDRHREHGSGRERRDPTWAIWSEIGRGFTLPVHSKRGIQ